jgi:tetratricopeptide (TPR) repeat protein
MMQHPITIAATSTLLLAISAVAASGADQTVWDQCNRTRDPDASIVACTQILQAPDETTSNRAIAYYVRAGAYRIKGENDQAIADYTKAIETNSSGIRLGSDYLPAYPS